MYKTCYSFSNSIENIFSYSLDLPSILSGEGVGFLDPHRRFFEIQIPDQITLEKTSSYLWHLNKDKAKIAELKDQFNPFKQELFGVTDETFNLGFFKGTIFRFPFRSGEMKSDLSKTNYDITKIKSLLSSLEADAHNMLLFLKNLEVIEFYEKSKGKTTKLLDIRIADIVSEIVRGKRQEFVQDMTTRCNDWKKQLSALTTYPMVIEVTKDNDISKKVSTHWFISQYFAGREDGATVNFSNNLGFLPTVGVALLVPIKLENGSPLCQREPKGHIFCFLPLPLEKKSPTGLQFHVHGSFAIDQNRRHIKWPSADQTSTSDESLLWNQFLVNKVLPKAMLGLTSYLIENCSKNFSNLSDGFANLLKACEAKYPEFMAQLIYSVIPNKEIVTPQWQGLVESFYKDVWAQRLFYSPVYGGRWLHYEDTIFDNVENTDEIYHLVRTILSTDERNLSCLPAYILKRLPPGAKTYNG